MPYLPPAASSSPTCTERLRPSKRQRPSQPTATPTTDVGQGSVVTAVKLSSFVHLTCDLDLAAALLELFLELLRSGCSALFHVTICILSCLKQYDLPRISARASCAHVAQRLLSACSAGLPLAQHLVTRKPCSMRQPGPITFNLSLRKRWRFNKVMLDKSSTLPVHKQARDLAEAGMSTVLRGTCNGPHSAGLSRQLHTRLPLLQRVLQPRMISGYLELRPILHLHPLCCPS